MEKELEGCTFKPDLGLSAKYNKNANKEQEKTSKEKRIDQLHNQGTQKLAKRQDQDFIDYDLKNTDKNVHLHHQLIKRFLI